MFFLHFTAHRAAYSRLILAGFFATLLLLPFPAAAGSLTSAKDTLSNSRPSFLASITADVNAGDTTIQVGSTTGFVEGDAVLLCNSTCTVSETAIINTIPSLSSIILLAGTTNSYLTGGKVYLRIASTHTVTFTTRAAVLGGSFKIYVPAGATPNTTIPDTGGFVFNTITLADISVSGITPGTLSTSTSGSNLIFTVPFSGSVAGGTTVTVTIGNSVKMFNPIKTASQGTADTFTVTIEELDAGGNTNDNVSMKIGTIEAVAVSATVIATSFNFTINPTPSGFTVGGTTTDAASTATTVPMGNLAVNQNRTVAQYIHIDTNSTSGYIITAQSDGQLRKTNGTIISDYNTTAADNDSSYGFGYSLQNRNNTPAAFQYSDSGTFYSKGFSSTTPVTIMSNNAQASGDEAYVIYRVRIGASQPQGAYQNLVTYIATAIF